MVENLIKTGSEDNSLFIYYKKISSPMLTYKFPVKVLNNLLLTTFLKVPYYRLVMMSQSRICMSVLCVGKRLHISLIQI